MSLSKGHLGSRSFIKSPRILGLILTRANKVESNVRLMIHTSSYMSGPSGHWYSSISSRLDLLKYRLPHINVSMKQLIPNMLVFR